MNDSLRIPGHRNRFNGAVSYGNPEYWQYPERWERVHILTDDELADELLTDRAIEAAAQSLHATHGDGDWDDEYEETREQYRQDAHDAIQAAIGAIT